MDGVGEAGGIRCLRRAGTIDGSVAREIFTKKAGCSFVLWGRSEQGICPCSAIRRLSRRTDMCLLHVMPSVATLVGELGAG